jgi:multisubunit Na+/H+ antiporter MnhF subunit
MQVIIPRDRIVEYSILNTKVSGFLTYSLYWMQVIIPRDCIVEYSILNIKVSVFFDRFPTECKW